MTAKSAALRSVLLVFALLSSAVAADAVDVVLALDNSLSMHANDPGRVSVDAAALFVDLLGEDDSLALMTFGADAVTLMPLTPLSAAGAQARASGLLQGIVMDGRMTNFEAALSMAYRPDSSAHEEPAKHRAIVLFSDGQMNLGTEDATAQARAQILQRILPQLQAAQIHVYGVAFSPDADLELLRLLGVSTGGFAFVADAAENVPEAFVHLFEQADQPLMAPLRDGLVKIDPAVESLKLLVERGPGDPPVRVTDPSSQELASGSARQGVTWKRLSRFDHITIARPEPGAWKVSGGASDGRAYLESAIGLEIQAPLVAEAHRSFQIGARLTDDGGPIDPSLAEGVVFTAIVTQDSSHLVKQIRLESSGLPGEAGATLQLMHPGAARIEVSAYSSQFQRVKATFVEVVEHDSPLAKAAEHARPPAQAEVKRQAVLILIAANAALALLAGIVVAVYRWRAGIRRRRGIDGEE